MKPFQKYRVGSIILVTHIANGTFNLLVSGLPQRQAACKDSNCRVTLTVLSTQASNYAFGSGGAGSSRSYVRSVLVLQY